MLVLLHWSHPCVSVDHSVSDQTPPLFWAQSAVPALSEVMLVAGRPLWKLLLFSACRAEASTVTVLSAGAALAES